MSARSSARAACASAAFAPSRVALRGQFALQALDVAAEFRRADVTRAAAPAVAAPAVGTRPCSGCGACGAAAAAADSPPRLAITRRLLLQQPLLLGDGLQARFKLAIGAIGVGNDLFEPRQPLIRELALALDEPSASLHLAGGLGEQRLGLGVVGAGDEQPVQLLDRKAGVTRLERRTRQTEPRLGRTAQLHRAPVLPQRFVLLPALVEGEAKIVVVRRLPRVDRQRLAEVLHALGVLPGKVAVGPQLRPGLRKLRIDVGGAQEELLGPRVFAGLARLLPGANELRLGEIGAARRQQPELLDGEFRPARAVVERGEAGARLVVSGIGLQNRGVLLLRVRGAAAILEHPRQVQARLGIVGRERDRLLEFPLCLFRAAGGGEGDPVVVAGLGHLGTQGDRTLQNAQGFSSEPCRNSSTPSRRVGSAYSASSLRTPRNFSMRAAGAASSSAARYAA